MFVLVASDLGDEGILQKLGDIQHRVNHMYLDQELEELKDDPREDRVVESPAAASISSSKSLKNLPHGPLTGNKQESEFQEMSH